MSNNDPIQNAPAQRVSAGTVELLSAWIRRTSWSTQGWLAFMSLPILGMTLIGLATDFSGIDVALTGLAHSPTHRDWFLALNSATSYLPPGLWATVTMLGDGAILLLVISPLLCSIPKAWWAAIASAPFAGTYSALGKEWAAVPRPAAVLDHGTFTIIGDALTGHNSFPSGHSVTVFAAIVAILATLTFRSRTHQSILVLGGLAIASVVCVSRVAIGAHWPLDLLAGAFGGSLAGLIGAAVVRHLSSPSMQIPYGVKRWGTAALLVTLSLSILLEPYPGIYAVTMASLAAVTGLAVSSWILLQSARQSQSPVSH